MPERFEYTTLAKKVLYKLLFLSFKLVQPFLQSSRQEVPTLYNGPSLFPPQNCPFTWGIWTRSRHKQHLNWFSHFSTAHNG